MRTAGKNKRCISGAVIVAAVLAIASFSCGEVEKAATGEQKGLIKVVVVTGGHEFERKPFLAMFDSFKNINYIEAEQKNDSKIFENIDKWDYDVIVLFNMTQEISPQRRKNFTELLERGVGLLALHHSIGSFQKWPEYRRIIGAKSYLEPTVEDGKTYQACGFLHDIDYNIKVEDAGHPVTQGLRDFAVHDETYNNCVYEADNRLLLSTDHPTSDKPLGWVRNYGKSNVCYIQMGHGPEIYADDSFRRLVSQAIEWCAGPPRQKAGETKQDEKAAETIEPIVNSIGMKLVYIPAGEFVMGSPVDEAGRQGDEMQHTVKLTRPFWIGATEVTQAQWKAVMGVNRSNFEGDDLPAEKLSWKEAEAFCKKLSEKEGVRYRLPTEAEWEYACRAGAAGAFSGTGNLDDMGWYASNSEGRTHPVGTKKPNGWGVYDMHGNVSEWCSDIYGADYPQGPVTDPAGAADGKYRVLRGGSWNYFVGGCRCAARSSAPASYQLRHTGFRVVMEATK